MEHSILSQFYPHVYNISCGSNIIYYSVLLYVVRTLNIVTKSRLNFVQLFNQVSTCLPHQIFRLLSHHSSKVYQTGGFRKNYNT